MTITPDQLRSVIGATANDPSGAKIGKVGQVYYDDDTNQPKWVTVHTGLFGTSESFVPLQGAEVRGDAVTLAYDKATIKDAPSIAEDAHLSPEEEERLYRHYGLAYGGGVGEAGVAGRTDTRTEATRTEATRTEARTETGTAGRGDVRDDVRDTAVGRDTSGPTTDDAMTRSEERLRVGTESAEAGRVRLRKHVVTEHQQVSVPVSHEEVRLEREPVTEANVGRATEGPAISEEEHEVTLHAERPVVSKEAEPVERVRLGKETVTEQETVGDEVRREEIELDDSETRRRR